MSSAIAIKQIRFVNSGGQPPAKRRRVNAACRTCRKRKIRCDGKRPICLTCAEGGHECLGYAADTPDRKNSPESLRRVDEYKEDYERYNGRRRSAQGVNSQSPITPGNRGAESNSYFQASSIEGHEKRSRANSNGSSRHAAGFSGDQTPTDRHTGSLRVPYFRYFGPTAIVPGFKQMVVSVREHRRSTGAGSSVPLSPRSGFGMSSYGKTAPHGGLNSRSSVDLPVYEQNDPLPVNRLIISLIDTFFVHLGCNFPFLQQRSFKQSVEERSAETILVDAVCALASRFSDHPLLTAGHDRSYAKSDYGQIFAQRAKAAVVDTFPCPSVAAVQACLLLAYEGFGANQDSALWMYLGCSIRMAVDLGLQKLDGVRHQGQRDPRYHRASMDSPSDAPTPISAQERMEIEQERIDTLWTVFMLDRVISSGTGRPVTLRDKNFELSFPTIASSQQNEWPNPFPALIRIIHLYGRVSDLLNNIRNIQDVTAKKTEGLSEMEKDLTQLYQKLDTRLTFNAENFQHYVKVGQGTNFILVHFWFHTLIMLLHQPTLMHSFEGQISQLLPNSRELSMSSAKTIADILAFAELIDPKSFIGNPFTSQPMYIAACAFLMESAAHTTSQPTSRDASPPPKNAQAPRQPGHTRAISSSDQKHSLLASAANQNYQRCYKALQQLEIYWAGTRYILVALDQKAKGIWDPETYTEQEYESTKIRNEIIPAWRRKLLASAPSPGSPFGDFARPSRLDTASPGLDLSQAIGWSLTGTTNSPSSNLTLMYQNMNSDQSNNHTLPPIASAMMCDPIRHSLPEPRSRSSSTSDYEQSRQSLDRWSSSESMGPPLPKYTPMSSEPPATSDAEMLLGLNSPQPHKFLPRPHLSDPRDVSTPPTSRQDAPFYSHFHSNVYSPSLVNHGLGGVGDMMMESQEIDMSNLGGDMMPWLDYLPQDILQFFDSGHGSGIQPSHRLGNNISNG